MTSITRHFFVNGNTAHGFKSLLDSSLQGIEQLFIMKQGSLAARTSILSTLADELVAEGYETWFIHSPLNNSALDGIIVPALKLGIIDGARPQFQEPLLSNATPQYIDVSEAVDCSILQANQKYIEELSIQINEAYDRAYAGFTTALHIHDEWEALYINRMDFQSADELTDHYIRLLYGEHNLSKSSRIDHRFLGAATPQGAVDYVPNLTQELKRYFIKGRAGSGKSTMLKKLSAEAIQRGLDVEIYHCGFDSNSLDMIIVRELGFAIFDSTAPHEYFPERADDEVIDMYASCIQPGTDEDLAEAITDIQSRYRTQMKKSTEQLALAKSLQDHIEQIHAESVNPLRVADITNHLRQRIHHITAKTF